MTERGLTRSLRIIFEIIRSTHAEIQKRKEGPHGPKNP